MGNSESNLLNEYYYFYDVKDRDEFLNRLADERNTGLSLTELSIWRRFNERRFEFSSKEGEPNEYYDRYFGFLLEQIFSMNLIARFNKMNKTGINTKFELFFDNEVKKVLDSVAGDLELDVETLGDKNYKQALNSLKPAVELIMTYELIHTAKKYLFISDSNEEKENRFEKLLSLTKVWESSSFNEKNKTVLLHNWENFIHECEDDKLNIVLK